MKTPKVTTKYSAYTATTTLTKLVDEDSTRRELLITNTSPAVLYIQFSGIPSSTNYAVAIPSGGLFVTATVDRVNGVWTSAAGGQANIVEEF